jgi:hypothetical protein
MDSRGETLKHIKEVAHTINLFKKELKKRAKNHDKSKMESPEVEIFDEYTPKLKGSTYGSDEYKEYLKEMKVALDHHYKNNQHHPEFHPSGIDSMNLIDIIEMFSDWVAATKRHEDGDMRRSLDINKTRFNMSDQLYNILLNTLVALEDSNQI